MNTLLEVDWLTYMGPQQETQDDPTAHSPTAHREPAVASHEGAADPHPEAVPETVIIAPATGTGMHASRKLTIVGSIGVALSLVFGVIGWILVGELTDGVEASLTLSEEALVAVDDTIGLAGSALGNLRDGVETLEGSVGDSAATLTNVGVLFDEASTIAAEDLPDSVGSLRRALPPLIDSARLVTDALEAISIFGIDLAPTEPIEAPLAQIDLDLLELETRLRSQAGVLTAVGNDFGSFSSDATDLAASLGDINSNLAATRDVLEGYEATAATARQTVDDTRDQLDASVRMARLLVILIAVMFALLQIVPFSMASVAQEVATAIPVVPDRATETRA